MYTVVLAAHSWIRWLALVAGLGGAVQAFQTPDGGSRRAGGAQLAFMIAMDLQLLLGLVLYIFLSPFTHEAFGDFAAAMKAPGLRFWAVEHVAAMAVAVVLTHVGRRAAKSGHSRNAGIFYLLAIVLMAIGMPWPFRADGAARPLFRL